MSVTEGQIPVGDTGKLLDTAVVTQADGTSVHREVVVQGDPALAAARTHLEPFLLAAETRYASPVTGVELRSLCDHLATLIEGQRVTNMLLNRLIGENLTTDDLEDY